MQNDALYPLLQPHCLGTFPMSPARSLHSHTSANVVLLSTTPHSPSNSHAYISYPPITFVTAADRGTPCWRVHEPVVPGESEFLAFGPQPVDWDVGAVRKQPYLHKAAEFVAQKSCGEKWMLQPKISKMPQLEYRCGRGVEGCGVV